MLEQRYLTFLTNKQKCRLNGKKRALKTLVVVEDLPNGEQKTLHSGTRFEAANKKSPFLKLIKGNKRRAA